MEINRQTFVDSGKRGGEATKAKYGQEYYRIIAKKPRKPRQKKSVDKLSTLGIDS